MTYQYMELKIKELEKRIEALEQEPSGDLISREAVISNVKELFSMGDYYCDKAAIVGMINSLPSVKPPIANGVPLQETSDKENSEIKNEVKDLSKRVENIENQMKEDMEERLKKLKAELDYAKFCCSLADIK